ncbi:hypothetical protein FOE78_16905 [Microlunatus elymi]|uniref:Uncharacterized protein n=1 Tax=Microlunatus elymi TaxID=2596828 RepID=A0A516Q1S4_9ACTN|nr:hypothetical protein [Microlunatus elymi]QDP97377.1 hypothetical protein FOE78_16905 [Microlunatus elymi]
MWWPYVSRFLDLDRAGVAAGAAGRALIAHFSSNGIAASRAGRCPPYDAVGERSSGSLWITRPGRVRIGLMIVGMTQFLSDDPHPTPPSIDQAPPVHDSEELRQRWRSLLGSGGFGLHSLWAIWFDRDGRQLPAVLPIDDLPDRLDPDMLRSVIWMVNGVRDQGACSVALLLSRPGPSRVTELDKARATAILTTIGDLRATGEFELALWPMHLATADSVRTLSADDLV